MGRWGPPSTAVNGAAGAAGANKAKMWVCVGHGSCGYHNLNDRSEWFMYKLRWDFVKRPNLKAQGANQPSAKQAGGRKAFDKGQGIGQCPSGW
jgi:hypothetical protein